MGDFWRAEKVEGVEFLDNLVCWIRKPAQTFLAL